MVVAARTQTISLDEHEIRSLRRWLNEMAVATDRDIFLQRAPLDFSRPAYVLKEIDRNPIDRGRAMTADQADWQIEILTEDFWDTKRQLAEIRQRLLQVRRIPLYLYGWKYPVLAIEELLGQGSLDAGEISVGVAAVNHEGEESLMSSSVQLTVSLNSAVKVLWTPWPRGVPVAKEYRVYAGALDAETLEATITDPGKQTSISYDIQSLAGGGDSPLSSSVFFANRYLRIDDDFTSSRMMEHPAADGVFNGILSFRTVVESVRIDKPGIDPVREIGTVTKSLEVG